MRIVLASSNKGKIKEIKSFLKGWEVLSFDELIEPFEVEESGKTFKENALLKARAIYNALPKKEIVLSDDSGISLPILNNEPGIYSARYAKIGANDKENLAKLIRVLKEKNIEKTPAFYTAAIGIVSPFGEFSVHGWMHGVAIDEALGDKGFGYDPMFIPEGFNLTLGQMEEDEKIEISHRTKALKLAKILLSTFKGSK